MTHDVEIAHLPCDEKETDSRSRSTTTMENFTTVKEFSNIVDERFFSSTNKWAFVCAGAVASVACAKDRQQNAAPAILSCVSVLIALTLFHVWPSSTTSETTIETADELLDGSKLSTHEIGDRKKRPKVRFVEKAEAAVLAPARIAGGDGVAGMFRRDLQKMGSRSGRKNTSAVAAPRVGMDLIEKPMPGEEPSEFDMNRGSRAPSDMRTNMKNGYDFNKLKAEESGSMSMDNLSSNFRPLDVAPQDEQIGMQVASQDAAQTGIGEIPVTIPADPGQDLKNRHDHLESGPDSVSFGGGGMESVGSAFQSTAGGSNFTDEQIDALINAAKTNGTVQ